MLPTRYAVLLLLPLLAACSEMGATFEIKGRDHALSLIRTINLPWKKTAEYEVVAIRLPDCMRKHPMPEAGREASVEVFSPGNNAWILRQEGRLYVVETRTCEGFAPLAKAPESGLGEPMGRFEMKGEKLVFTAAPRLPAPAVPSPPVEPVVDPAASETPPASNP